MLEIDLPFWVGDVVIAFKWRKWNITFSNKTKKGRMTAEKKAMVSLCFFFHVLDHGESIMILAVWFIEFIYVYLL